MNLSLLPLIKWLYRGVLVVLATLGVVPSINVDLNYYWPILLAALVTSFTLLITEHEIKRRQKLNGRHRSHKPHGPHPGKRASD